MTDAIVPSWHGNNYQARFFWEHALNLLEASTCVVEVTFEADGPKAFDDVVVRYDPPVVRSGPNRVSAEFHQVKWHVDIAGCFGFEDFTQPAFVGAQSVSLLQRLKAARDAAPADSSFIFVTTYRIKDGDPLRELICGVDRSLLVHRLFDGTTDRSKMGKVRKCWREHLGVANDDDLHRIVTGFRIMEGHRTLDEMRQQINFKARAVGLKPCSNAQSDFRFDELARQLKIHKINRLTRADLMRICREEGLLDECGRPIDPYLDIAIRSFLGVSSDIVGASPNNTLLLTEHFKQRHLKDDKDWQADIRPQVENFLRQAVLRSPKLRLTLDAHASIAFLAGSVLDLKSGISVELVQKGRVGAKTWRADDGSGAAGSPFVISADALSSGQELAVVINIAQDATPQATAYVQENLQSIGRIVSFTPTGGPGPRSVAGGEHAANLADQIAIKIRALKAQDSDAVVHIFAACPNTLLFFLGQQFTAIAPCILYEFDFDRAGNRSYQPAFAFL